MMTFFLVILVLYCIVLRAVNALLDVAAGALEEKERVDCQRQIQRSHTHTHTHTYNRAALLQSKS